VGLEVLSLEQRAAEWDAALRELAPRQQDVFFTSGYLRLWERRGEGRAMGAVYRERDGLVLYPFLLRDLSTVEYLGAEFAGLHDVTSPMGFGGPLVRHKTGEEALAAFRTEIDGWCHANAVVTEFIRFHPLLETRLGMERHLEIEEAGKVVWARLDAGSCALIETLSGPARRSIRRARDAGLTTGVETGTEAWDRFAALYLENALRRKALPAFRFDATHFRNLRELLGDRAVLFGARHEGVLVAAALFLLSHDFVHFHALGADRAYAQLRPANLLFFDALQWACTTGATAVNLGGGYRGDDEFFRFKLGFAQQVAPRRVGRAIHLFEPYGRAELRREEQGEILDCQYFPAYRAPLPRDSLIA
jgi:Acetyltransferase (GNAT) domain